MTLQTSYKQHNQKQSYQLILGTNLSTKNIFAVPYFSYLPFYVANSKAMCCCCF